MRLTVTYFNKNGAMAGTFGTNSSWRLASSWLGFLLKDRTKSSTSHNLDGLPLQRNHRPRLGTGIHAARDRRIFEMWMACWTGAEIAKAVGCDEKTVSAVVSGKSAELPNVQKAAASVVS